MSALAEVSQSSTEDYHLGTADTLKLIRSMPAGTHWLVSVHPEFRIKDTPDRYFPGYVAVEVSKAQLIKLASNALSGFEARGGTIRSRVYTSGTYKAFYLF